MAQARSALCLGLQVAEPGPPSSTSPDPRPEGRLERARPARPLAVRRAAVLRATGTVTSHYLEDWGWVDSLYFSTVAITTVGFADLTPTTDASKLFTVVSIFSGIGLITTYLQARLQVRGRQTAAIRGDLGPDDDASSPSGS